MILVVVSNFTATSDYNGFIAKYNTNFVLQFAKKISGTEDQETNDLVIFDEIIYVTGSFEKDIDIDPDIGTQIYVMQGATVGKDIWFAKYNYTDGSLVDSWHIEGGGTFSSEGVKIRLDEWGYIYLGMVSWGDNDYDPTSGINNISSNSKDVTLAKYTNSGDFYGLVQ